MLPSEGSIVAFLNRMWRKHHAGSGRWSSMPA